MIAAARHYWNAIKPFIVEPIERELLREPMEAVLECIAAVAVNEVGKEDEVREVINRPFPSSLVLLVPLSLCKTFLLKMSLICMKMNLERIFI